MINTDVNNIFLKMDYNTNDSMVFICKTDIQ
jgi:hypothetical protein